MDVPLVKSGLRELLRKRRASLDEATRVVYSQAITQRLIAGTDWEHIRRVHCYLSMEKYHEVDTWLLLRYLWQQWPDIEVAMPGPIQAGRPTSLAIDMKTQLRPTGTIPCPLVEHVVPNEGFDLIVVPILGFDDDCYRLGYGSGYYDRFLGEQQDANTVGLSFSCCFIAEDLPHEEHDVSLQTVITENLTYGLAK